jgi:hypothetical protein
MRAERRAAASLSYVLSGTSAVVVISLILFYAIELPTGRLRVFGSRLGSEAGRWRRSRLRRYRAGSAT